MTCVSIGYCENGRPVVGVIYVPGTKELYLGVQGYGAYRNGVRIQQSPEMSTKSLSTAVVCCEFGYCRDKTHVDTILGGLSKVVQSQCRAIRQLGSGCLDLCLVASGRIDVVYAGLATEGWKVRWWSQQSIHQATQQNNHVLTDTLLYLFHFTALGLCGWAHHLSRSGMRDGIHSSKGWRRL